MKPKISAAPQKRVSKRGSQRRHDSKLRGCDLVTLAVTDLVKDERVREGVSVI